MYRLGYCKYSNTTLVKVKLVNNIIVFILTTIQIQHLLKLNVLDLPHLLPNCSNSNTTLVKVKLRSINFLASSILHSNTTLVKVK